MVTRLFTYGTLRQGLKAPINDFFKQHVRWLTQGSITGYLFDLGDYPGAVYDSETREVVQGDVFDILDAEALFPLLDEYEGCAPGQPDERREYDRIIVPVHTNLGTLDCWVYHYRLPIHQLKPIPDGDFLKYLNDNER